MSDCIYTGAYVAVPDYGIYAPADLFKVANAVIIRFSFDPQEKGLFEPARPVTHIIHTMREDDFIRFDLGMLVIYSESIERTINARY